MTDFTVPMPTPFRMELGHPPIFLSVIRERRAKHGVSYPIYGPDSAPMRLARRLANEDEIDRATGYVWSYDRALHSGVYTARITGRVHSSLPDLQQRPARSIHHVSGQFGRMNSIDEGDDSL
jgi:hypothetical protein